MVPGRTGCPPAQFLPHSEATKHGRPRRQGAQPVRAARLPRPAVEAGRLTSKRSPRDEVLGRPRWRPFGIPTDLTTSPCRLRGCWLVDGPRSTAAPDSRIMNRGDTGHARRVRRPRRCRYRDLPADTAASKADRLSQPSSRSDVMPPTWHTAGPPAYQTARQDRRAPPAASARMSRGSAGVPAVSPPALTTCANTSRRPACHTWETLPTSPQGPAQVLKYTLSARAERHHPGSAIPGRIRPHPARSGPADQSVVFGRV